MTTIQIILAALAGVNVAALVWGAAVLGRVVSTARAAHEQAAQTAVVVRLLVEQLDTAIARLPKTRAKRAPRNPG